MSSVDQNTIRQLDGVQVDKKYVDHASGKDANRPQLQLALDYAREGDVLVVHSMDRLARNITDLLRTVETLNSRGVIVEFVKESLSFTGDDSAISKLTLTIMGAVAAGAPDMTRTIAQFDHALDSPFVPGDNEPPCTCKACTLLDGLNAPEAKLFEGRSPSRSRLASNDEADAQTSASAWAAALSLGF